ncbi:hypothetical protein M514_28259 [Trichuris suis]|uniref:Uncharacterized protein n=1 Tax=Trichuris suis TaxID=68888 RepID=A0A085MQR5_9BILA|nr:hypothetical protein M514_28259 [Trichuris suis]
MEIMIVDCRFAVEIIQYGPGKLLAALCYQNTITGSRSTKGSRHSGSESTGTEAHQSALAQSCTKELSVLGNTSLGTVQKVEISRYKATAATVARVPEITAVKCPIIYNCKSRTFWWLHCGNNSTSQNTTQWPVNNYERTGFGGKGTLPQFGPNPALYLLVTRRSNGTTEVFIEETDDYTALPQLWVNTSTTVEGPTEPKESKLTTYCNMSEIYTMLQNRTQYHNGYLKNRYNTDNAWLEGTIIHPHDDTGGCFSRFPVNTEVQSRRYRWLVLPNSTTPRNFALSFGISSGVHLGNGTHAYS